LLLWARRSADIDRMLHGRLVAVSSSRAAARHAAANAGSATLSADVITDLFTSDVLLQKR